MRYVAATDYMRLWIWDDQSSITGSRQTMRLAYRKGGASTYITNALNISFVRGTYHTVKVTLDDTTLALYWDGVLAISVTDSSWNMSGKCGFYNTGAYSTVWQGLSVMQYGDAGSGKRVYTRQTLTTTDPLTAPTIHELNTSVRDTHIMSGTVLPQTQYAYKSSLAACLDDAANKAGYWWKIGSKQNEWRYLYFLSRAAQQAPWPLSSANGDILYSAKPKLVYGNSKYRNRQYVTGGVEVATVPERKIGDGVTHTWVFSYPIMKIISLDVNGAKRTAAIKDSGVDADFYYTPGENTFLQRALDVPLTGDEILTVLYEGEKPYIAMKENTDQQHILARMNGTSGIVEVVENVAGLSMVAADALAQARIDQYAILSRNWAFSTRRSGLAVGQMLRVFVPELNIVNVPFFITDVATTIKQAADGSLLYFYDVKATEGPIVGRWSKLFEALGGT
jgi:hypothetical protein